MAPTPQTELTPKTTDADAVARAAIERAEKAERKAAELQKKLDERPKSSKESELAELRAQLEGMQRDREEMYSKLEAAAAVASTIKRGPAPLAPEFKGTKTYRVKIHYRAGLMYGPGQIGGEFITVTDEKPGKGWVEVKKVAATQLAEVTPTADKPQRASDVEV